MTYLCFDTETTGLVRRRGTLHEACSIAENGDEIIQIGGIVFDEFLEVHRAFCYYCDAMLPESSADARAVHGIYLNDIRQKVPGMFFEEVAWKLIPEFFIDDVTYTGYNIDFDMQMVAQSMRNFAFPFEKCTPVMGRLFTSGRHTFDIMKYLPRKSRLVQFSRELTPARKRFFKEYAGKLPLEVNIPELFISSWEHNHNALYDAIETYLLMKEKIWGQKILLGRR